MTYYLNWDLRHESQPALKKKSKHEIKLSKDEIWHLIDLLNGSNNTGTEVLNLKQLAMETLSPTFCLKYNSECRAIQEKYVFLQDLAHKLETFILENK